MFAVRHEKITIPQSMGTKSRISAVASQLNSRLSNYMKCKVRLINYSTNDNSFELTYELIGEVDCSSPDKANTLLSSHP